MILTNEEYLTIRIIYALIQLKITTFNYSTYIFKKQGKKEMKMENKE